MSWVFRLSLTFLSRLRSLRRSFFRRRLLLRLRESDEYESLRDEDRDSVLYDRRRRRFLRRCFRCLRLRRSLLRLPLLLRLLLLLLLRVRLRLRRLRSFLPRSLLRLRDLLDSLWRSDPLGRPDPFPSSGPASAPLAGASRSSPIRPECPTPAGAPPLVCHHRQAGAQISLFSQQNPRRRVITFSAIRHRWRPASPPSRPRSAPPPARATPQSPAPLA